MDIREYLAVNEKQDRRSVLASKRRGNFMGLCIIAAAVVSGCSGTVELTESEKEAAFLDLMYNDNARWRSVPASSLLSNAKLVCFNLDLGEDKDRLIELSTRGAFGPVEAASLVNNAIQIYCPEFDQ